MTTPALLTYSKKTGVHVDLDILIRSRLLIQANSGGGKSWALRQLLEETFGKVQHIVIDPEGEYHTLREQFDYVLAARHGGDVEASPRTAKMLCRRLMETSASAVIDLYDLPIAGRREFVKLFLTELMALPKDMRRPLLVVLDEAHIFAPEGARSDALEAVMSLASQGRKRGYALVCATQRLSKLSKDVAAEMLTRLIGRTGLDLDVKRAGDELGMDKEGRGRLPMLEPGQFYAFGPALPPGPPRLVRTGDVHTSHPQPGALEAPTPPPSAKVKALISKSMADLPQQATEEARTVDTLTRKLAETERRMRLAEKTGSIARAKTIEKIVVDQKAIDRAVAGAVAPYKKANAELVKIARTTHDAAQRLVAMTGTLPVVDPEGTIPALPFGIKENGAVTLKHLSGTIPSSALVRSGSHVPENDLTGPEQRILNAIAWMESIGIEKPELTAVAFLAGYRIGGGAFNNPRGALRAKGLVEYVGDYLVLTDAGRALAMTPDTVLTTEELQKRVLGRLPGPEQKLLQVLIDSYPSELSAQQVAEAAGYQAGGGAFNNPKGRLRTLGLIEYPRAGYMVARSILFV